MMSKQTREKYKLLMHEMKEIQELECYQDIAFERLDDMPYADDIRQQFEGALAAIEQALKEG